MKYESVIEIRSEIAPGVTFEVVKMSYGRRVELMRRIRELTARQEFLNGGDKAIEKMDAALLEAEINRLYLLWGVRAISGLIVDGAEATPEKLAESGPEDLFQEVLIAVRKQAGLTGDERKN